MQTRISGCAYIKINDYLRICVGSGHSLQFSHHNNETQHTRESRVPCRSHEDIFYLLLFFGGVGCLFCLCCVMEKLPM